MSFFANVPVADLERSNKFYSALGWKTEAKMTGDKGSCWIVADGVYLMTATREFFASLGPKPIGDPATHCSVAFAFDFPTREELDAFVAKVEPAGGKLGGTDDYGFMFQVDFEDPDGNQFAPFWAAPQE